MSVTQFTRPAIRPLILAAALAFGSVGSALAATPSLQEVYQAAHSGQLQQAQQMMQEVLQAHPQSAKAHFVEAEILARQGDLQRAGQELAKAQQLEPGLPFAKPQAVAELQRRLAGGGSGGQISTPAPQHASGFSWTPLIFILAGGAFIGFLVSLFRRNPRNVGSYGATSYPTGGNNPGYPNAGYPPQPGSYYPPQAGGGLGSTLAKGAATGVAVGAGLVAGEALAHHFLDGNSNSGGNPTFLPPDDPTTRYDMGGSDFGVSDSGGWDDGGSDFGMDSGGDDSWS